MRLSHVVMREALIKYALLDNRDKAFLNRLVYGSLEYQIQIDFIISKYSSVKLNKIKPIILNILRLSIYQILYMDKVPDTAACDEAVKLTKKRGFQGLSGFTNGILRNISREKASITALINNSSKDIKYSCPIFLLDLVPETLLQKSLENNDIYVRALKPLDNISEELKPSGIFEDMYVLTDASKLTELKEWKNGTIYVQDISSTLPVRYAELKTTDKVLDVCAAPGGKSIQAADIAKEVVSCDLTQEKISLINENIARTGKTNITTKVMDATVHEPKWDEQFDVVLADCPCSGLGTITRKPDIKNRITFEGIVELSEIQQKILCNVCNYVKPGGKLIYSTCTTTHYENKDNVDKFLSTHSDFALSESVDVIPDNYPQDGFFIAKLYKAAVSSDDQAAE